MDSTVDHMVESSGHTVESPALTAERRGHSGESGSQGVDSDVNGDPVQNCGKTTHVVSARQRTDVSLSVDFWASRWTSDSMSSSPSVICSVASRRRSSQVSDRTTSTLTSIVL